MSSQKNEGTESYHQLPRKERNLSREGVDKREKEGVGTLKINVPSYLLQLSLWGRLEKLEERMSAGKIASTEQVRGGCSDLWILLSQFSESLCYKGKQLLPGCLPPSGEEQRGGGGRDRLWSCVCSSEALQVFLAIVSHHVYITSGN